MVVVGGIFTTILLSLWVRRFLPSIPYFNKLILTATTGNTAEVKPSQSQDAWPFVGSVGVAVTDLKPGGSVEFPYADASRATAVVSSSGYVPAGTKVAVEQVHGNFVRVRAMV
jgi:membrane-bound ClpP family serine protease